MILKNSKYVFREAVKWKTKIQPDKSVIAT